MHDCNDFREKKNTDFQSNAKQFYNCFTQFIKEQRCYVLEKFRNWLS